MALVSQNNHFLKDTETVPTERIDGVIYRDEVVREGLSVSLGCEEETSDVFSLQTVLQDM